MISLNPWQAGIVIFCSIALVQTLYLSIVLGIKTKQRQELLYLSLLLIGLGLRISKSIYSHIWIEKVYWGVWLGCVGLWLVGPSLHMFSKIRHNQSVQRINLLFYIPVALLLCAYGSIDLSTLNWVYRIGTIFLSLQLVYYYLIQRFTYFDNPFLYRSLYLITGAFIVQLISGTIEWYVAGTILSCLALFYLNYSILVDPSLFKKSKNESKVKGNLDSNKILIQLDELIDSKHLYKTKGLTLTMIAELSDIPAYQISQAISQSTYSNFNQWVNSHRVSEIQKVLQDPNRDDKVESLAQEFGFSGVSTLYQAFKNETGMTIKKYKESFTKN